MRIYIYKFLLVIFAIFVTTLIAEGITRIFFDPIDYLWRTELSDPMLRYRVEPHTAGHDSWGYRNKYVPDSAEVVAVGDSQTYGESALAKYSWPSILEGLIGKKVYNMGLGGYGPAEYLYLMQNKAMWLKPKMIIAGFYLGNDLSDTYTAVYSIPYWKEFRKPEHIMKEIASIDPAKIPLEIKSPPPNPVHQSWKSQIYYMPNWLAGHSVLYRVITASYLGDKLRQNTMIAVGEEIVMLKNDEYGINTGFTPLRRLQALDLDKPDNREGLNLALEFFKRMNNFTNNHGITFLVVIIPTKESVYGDFILGNRSLKDSYIIDSQLKNEREVSATAQNFFEVNHIPYLDLLGPLSTAAKNEQLYPNNYSGHFNANGNRVIAETIKLYLDSH